MSKLEQKSRDGGREVSDSFINTVLRARYA